MAIKTMLHAGATTIDISPRQPTALYGYPHVERVSTGIHDPLLATVIILQGEDATLVLGALDLLMIDPTYARRLRRAIAQVAGCDEAGVLISCTHTHSGPVTSQPLGWAGDPAVPPPDPAYLEFVRTQMEAATAEAMAAAVPSELAWAAADATGVGGNRLCDDGVTDPECGLLAIRNAASHEMMAMAAIYGMHPTVLHEDSTLVSADFPYYTRRHIQEHVGRAIPIAYHTAPCGNQSPRRFVDAQTFDEAERLGRKLGAVVVGALHGLSPDAWHSDVELDACLREVNLPRNRIRPLPEAQELLAQYLAHYERLKREGAPRVEVRTAECAVFGAEGTVSLARAQADGRLDEKLADYLPTEVQSLRVGDVDLMGLPGECFTEYALEIKRRAARRTLVISLTNGDLQGYIVTPEAVVAGGYEATNAVFAAECGSVLVTAALDMAAEDLERHVGGGISHG